MRAHRGHTASTHRAHRLHPASSQEAHRKLSAWMRSPPPARRPQTPRARTGHTPEKAPIRPPNSLTPRNDTNTHTHPKSPLDANWPPRTRESGATPERIAPPPLTGNQSRQPHRNHTRQQHQPQHAANSTPQANQQQPEHGNPHRRPEH